MDSCRKIRCQRSVFVKTGYNLRFGMTSIPRGFNCRHCLTVMTEFIVTGDRNKIPTIFCIKKYRRNLCSVIVIVLLAFGIIKYGVVGHTIYCKMTKSSFAIARTIYGPPYLAFIVSPSFDRYYSAKQNLEQALPGYFKIEHFRSVSLKDPRIERSDNSKKKSLLLSFADMWLNVSSRFEYDENDWIFLFEDDVNIVNIKEISLIYSKLNFTNPQYSLVGNVLKIF